ncbi:hypothetical protein EIN_135160 [Entamoeba invadens IP1]|uniref:Uncharacterized protein n=1 Tax=Entamoeba invadens IP1 TaxID=370355 RepID=A0A0A1TXC5_ENTIV|nr:hypothetical protein EIN_135160 [Entamoeba invadens IP1]ELP85932.1 hypothetical protein EIN_135160 [Entamoeba invadens IP1]|eukprot:XP_004185278.1 hypothetical protein EIN_135160 [Entamoeba invadens IP1]
MIVLFLLLFVAISSPCETPVNCTIDQAFECFDSITITEEDSVSLKNAITHALDAYVYKDITQNPPQPDFDSNFFHKVNIDERLNEIKTGKQNFVEYFYKFQRLIFDLHDLHISISLKSNTQHNYFIEDFAAVLPFTMTIETDKKVYLPALNIITAFDLTMPPEVVENEKVEVEEIDGQTPFQYIRTFAEMFAGMKNEHAKFTYAKEMFGMFMMSYAPLTKEYLETPITVKYKNGVNISVNYQMMNLGGSIRATDNNKKTSKQLQIAQMKEFIDKKRRTAGAKIITAKDLFESSEVRKKRSVKETVSESINCQILDIDNEKVNVLKISSFSTDEVAEIRYYISAIKSCFEKFDENNGTIGVILPLNGGGYLDLESIIEKALSNDVDVNNYGSVRLSDNTVLAFQNGFNDLFVDTETCKNCYNSSTIGSFYTEPVTVNYGDVKHMRSKTEIIKTSTLDKLLTKNPRKPTEIVLMSDAFCYSACSLLTKGLQEKGGAIVVGYFGDPEGKLIDHDVGQSPTAIATFDEVLPKAEKDKMTEMGISMQFGFVETYKYNYNYSEEVPREYLIDVVDEQIFLGSYGVTRVNEFARTIKSVAEKYRTQCNKDNKKLVLRSELCDSKMTVEHAHGGYVCGDDGRWSEVCVPTYCDENYYFDFFNQKCVRDVCQAESHSSSQPSQSSSSSHETSSASSNTSTESKSDESGHSTTSSESNSSSEGSENVKKFDWNVVIISVITVVLVIVVIIVIIGVTICWLRKNKNVALETGNNYSRLEEVAMN